MRFEPRSRARRSLDLAPLVDVVFLLLVFFMLASRLSTDLALPLSVAPAPGASGALPDDVTRVDLRSDGSARIDGRAVAVADLAGAVSRAIAAHPDRAVWVVPEADVPLQRIGDLLALLASRGARGASLAREF